MMLLLFACTAETRTDRIVVAGDLVAVEVEMDAGTVRVRATDGDRVEVERRGVAGEVRHTLRDGVVRIVDACDAWLPCDTDLVVSIPARLAVDVSVGSGDVRVEGLGADLHVEVNDGDVDLSGIRSPTVRVQVGWGDVDLAFEGVPTDVAVSVGVGDVQLRVPEGAYDLDVESLAAPQVRIPHDPSGARIYVRTTSGRARIERLTVGH